jgi:hypothetical protein
MTSITPMSALQLVTCSRNVFDSGWSATSTQPDAIVIGIHASRSIPVAAVSGERSCASPSRSPITATTASTAQ